MQESKLALKLLSLLTCGCRDHWLRAYLASALMREIMNYPNVIKYQCPKSSWAIIVTYIDKTHQKLFLLTLFKRAKPGLTRFQCLFFRSVFFRTQNLKFSFVLIAAGGAASSSVLQCHCCSCYLV